MATDDPIWLDVLPSLRGFGPALLKGTASATTDAGKKAGKSWSDAFSGAAGDSGSSAALAALDKNAKAAGRIVDQQKTVVARARAAQADAAARVVDAESKLAAAVAKGGEDSDAARAAALRLEAAHERQRDAARKADGAVEGLAAAAREAKAAQAELAAATGEANGDVADSVSVWDKLGGALGSAKDKLSDAAGGMGGAVAGLAAATGAAALFGSAFGQAMDLEQGTANLTAALDLTEQQSARAGDVAGALYAGAYGESMQDVTTAVEAVLSSIPGMADASAAEIEAVTAGAFDLQTALGVDVTESATAAGIAIQNGLAGNGVEAMDLITASLQKVPTAMRGEVLEAANEYGGVLAGLGFTGEEAFGMLVSASDGGTIAIDKVGDAMKEFTIRATDMSAGSVAAYEAIGLNAQDMSNALLAGGDEAAGAMDQITAGLLGIEDPAEQANAAIALFGTPLEDLGVQEIPTFLQGLTDMNGGLGDVTGAAAEMGDTVNGTTAVGIEELKRSFMTFLSDGIAPLLGPVQQFLSWATETPGVLPAVAIALGVVAVAWAAMTLAASPWLAIGVGLAVVIGGIILAVNNWGAIVDWLKEKWEPIYGWINEKVFEPVKTGVGWVVDKFNAAKEGVVGAWNAAGSGLQTGWAWIDTNVFTPVKTGVGWVVDKFNAAKTGVGTAWSGIQSLLDLGKRWVDTHVFDPFKTAIGAIGTTFDNTQRIIDTAWSKVKAAAAAPVNFIIETVYTNGIKKTWDSIADAVGLSLSLPSVKPIRFATGGIMPGYSPGRDVHRFVSPTGGTLELSGGEPILRPEVGRVLGAGWVHGVNRAATSGGVGGVQQFLSGGPRQAFAGGGFFSNVGSWISGAVDAVADFIADPAGKIKELISAPVEAVLDSIGGGKLGQMLVELPRSVVAGIVDKAKDLAAGLFGGSDGPAPVGGWHRPSRGPITSRFGPRWGAFHAGIDVAGGGPTYAANNGKVRDVGWNILGGRSGIGIGIDHGGGTFTYYGHNPVGGPRVRPGQVVSAGQHIGYQGATGNVTGTHLHFELHKGGWGRAVNPTSLGVFDNGGLLPSNGLAMNLGNDPEPVLTREQWSDISRLASQAMVGSITVLIDPSDLDGLRSVEEFIDRVRRDARAHGVDLELAEL